MSYRWRQRQKILEQANTDAERGDDQAWSGELDIQYPPPDMEFPGPRETRILDSSNAMRPFDVSGVGVIRDPIDYEIGGMPGQTKFAGSLGVVDPSNVDAHDYNGAQTTIRRMRDTNFGDVATSDHNSLLSILYQHQESAHYFPNEVSEADLIRAV